MNSFVHTSPLTWNKIEQVQAVWEGLRFQRLVLALLKGSFRDVLLKFSFSKGNKLVISITSPLGGSVSSVPREALEVHVLRHQQRQTNSENLLTGLTNLSFKKSSRSFWGKFGKHWYRCAPPVIFYWLERTLSDISFTFEHQDGRRANTYFHRRGEGKRHSERNSERSSRLARF